MSSRKGFHSNYSAGVRAENKVASIYRSNGFDVKQSPGSRGSADLICMDKEIDTTKKSCVLEIHHIISR